MDVNADTLRNTYSRKSADELRRIVASAEGEYTPEAVLVAREVLAARPPEEPEPSLSATPSRRDKWSGIVAALMAAYVVKQVFYAWLAAERDPKAFEETIHRAVSDPWTYAFIAMPLVWLWWRRGRAAQRARQPDEDA
jgi:hypothetical protein